MQNLYDIAAKVIMRPPFVGKMQEYFTIEPRAAIHVPVPRHLRSGLAGDWISSNPDFEKGLWRHQAVALDHLHAGKNVCLTTPTSSGKTNVFIADLLDTFHRDPDAHALAFYSDKVLQADQLGEYQAAFKAAGLKPSDIGIINGDMKDHDERLKILRKAKLLILTSDVDQAWLMANLADNTVCDFLGSTRRIILDEVQVYERIFGAHAANLFKRQLIVIDQLKKQAGVKEKPLQIIAASATMRDAPGFLKGLTGQPFVEVGPEDDGSQKHQQVVFHIAATPREQGKLAKQFMEECLKEAKGKISGTGVCFHNSHRGVESLAASVNTYGHSIVPFMATYSKEMRKKIQAGLKKGEHEIAITTNVIERGANFPSLAMGLYIGRPPNSTSLPQSLGRVGRKQNGLFVVFCPADSFAKGRKGVTLKEACSGRLAQPMVYPGIQRVDAWHALCLDRELAMIGEEGYVPSQRRFGLSDDFMEALANIRDGKPFCDEEMAAKIRPKRSKPHNIFGIRELEFGENHELYATMLDGSTAHLGTLTQRQALFECYLGAHYLHMMQHFEVIGWYYNESGQIPTIRLKQVHVPRETHHAVSKWVNLPQDMKKLPGGRFSVTTQGRIVETNMRIHEHADGYYTFSNEQTKFIPYSERKKTKPRTKKERKRGRGGKEITKYQHYTATSGVLIDFRSEIFTERERRALAEAIKQAYCDRFNVVPYDVDCASARIYQDTKSQPRAIENAIVIYDRNSNGLRLTQRLAPNLKQIILDIADTSFDQKVLIKFARFCQGLNLAPAAARIEEATEAHSNAKRETPLFGTGGVAWCTAHKMVTQDQRMRKNRANGSREPMGWVKIEDMEHREGMVFYHVVEWDDPARPRRAPKGPDRTDGGKRWVPQSKLFGEPPNPT